MPAPFPSRLEDLLPPGHVLVERDVVAPYERDWTGRWVGEAQCVVRPGTTAQVARVVEACARAGQPLVVQGGNTGLVGGAVPVDGAVVLSTERLTRIGKVDRAQGRVEVGAGVTLADATRAAQDAGWDVGVDIASRDTATIGGMVATDAGGARVVRHGPMRQQVLGLEVVLGDGTVATPRSQGLPKDTAGYDLRHALVGSEGTLGVVTAVLLRLVRPEQVRASVLLGATAETIADTITAVRARAASSGADLLACELLTRESCELTTGVLGEPSPVDADLALLVDLGGTVPDDLLAALDDLGEGETVVALDATSRSRLWRVREAHTEAIARLGTPIKLDVAVPLASLGTFVRAVRSTVATVVPGATCVLFGHAAEGNLHVNVLGASDHTDALEEAVYSLVAGCGGTISAEHGVGRAKVRHLHLTTDQGSLLAMRRLKRALDPHWVLNPGAVVPAGI